MEPAGFDVVRDGRQVHHRLREGTTITALLALAAERGIDLVPAMTCGAPGPTARAGPGMPGSRIKQQPGRRTLPRFGELLQLRRKFTKWSSPQ